MTLQVTCHRLRFLLNAFPALIDYIKYRGTEQESNVLLTGLVHASDDTFFYSALLGGSTSLTNLGSTCTSSPGFARWDVQVCVVSFLRWCSKSSRVRNPRKKNITNPVRHPVLGWWLDKCFDFVAHERVRAKICKYLLEFVVIRFPSQSTGKISAQTVSCRREFSHGISLYVERARCGSSSGCCMLRISVVCWCCVAMLPKRRTKRAGTSMPWATKLMKL